MDISIAVATPKGLVVPVLRNADALSFAGIEKVRAEGKGTKIMVEKRGRGGGREGRRNRSSQSHHPCLLPFQAASLSSTHTHPPPAQSLLLSISFASQNLAALGKKAREGTISIDDMAGGTFTISNGGVYGSMMSTPIINPPQSAILGM